MIKSITYSIFLISGLAVALLFVTSRSYTQLGLAAALYIPLVFIAFKIFPRNEEVEEKEVDVQMAKTVVQSKEKVDVDDIDKRAFLKLIGIAGASFFLFSLLNRRASNIPFVKKVTGPDVTALEDAEGNKIDPAQTQPTDGYRISEVDDNAITFYGFIKKGGAWFIMKEDTDTGSFRYTKGDKDFSNNWSQRENLSYDYYSNVF